MSPGLNIAALTQRTGVPSDTLRKWEHRYGVLRPERTAGGQRRYSELDVARVEWLKARLEEGYRIGEAAALLGQDANAAGNPSELSALIVAAAVNDDVTALDRHVSQAVAMPSLEECFLDVLGPALVEVGRRWEAGELSVAQEHLASSTVRNAILKLLADPRPDVRGTAVLACAAGERHEIGLMMLAVLLRADGWQIAYLGADVPTEDALTLARSIGADALCFSATSDAVAQGIEGELAQLELPDEIYVLVGGRGVDDRDVRESVSLLRERVE